MIALPDYIVLDFLDWISKNCPRSKQFIDDLLNDREVAMDCAEKYLQEDHLRYRQCKKKLKRHVNRVIDSKEFEEILIDKCGDGLYNNCTWHNQDCLLDCYREFESLFHKSLREMDRASRFQQGEIYPYGLVESMYSYLDKKGLANNSTTMSLMIGYSKKDVSSMVDFLNWIKEQGGTLNFYKMPGIVFDDVVAQYEAARKINLSSKAKKEIKKCFKNKSLEQMHDWAKKVFGREKSRTLSYVFDRYYNDKAKYKCILLPIKGENHLETFVKKYWFDLNAASADALDIFYSEKELKNTGFASLEKIHDMTIDTNKLPCVVLWHRDISTAKAIKIRRLDSSDLYSLLAEIIDCIKKDMELEEIYKAAMKRVEELQENYKVVQTVEQNIKYNYGTAVAVNHGTVDTKISIDSLSFLDDIQQAKTELAKIEELTPDMRKFLYQLMEDAGKSVLQKDDELKTECVNKFKGFLAGAGKTASTILNMLGSISSIASFFCM